MTAQPSSVTAPGSGLAEEVCVSDSHSAQYEPTIEHGIGASEPPSTVTTVPSTLSPDSRAQLLWVEEQVRNSLEADASTVTSTATSTADSYPPTSVAVEALGYVLPPGTSYECICGGGSTYAFVGDAQPPLPARPALPLALAQLLATELVEQCPLPLVGFPFDSSVDS